MAETVWLHELDLNKMMQDWDRPQINRSISQKPLSIGGQTFEHGVGTHSHSIVYVDLAGGTDRFQAAVGLDDNAGGKGSITFDVIADNRTVFQSGVMTSGQAAMPVDVDVRGVRTLLLLVGDAGDGFAFDHANWAEARFIVSGAKPRTIPMPDDTPVILTPKPGPAPRINGPKVYGCRPGNPFIYRIPTTGERPIAFSADGLPASLRLDAATGILTGQAPDCGESKVTLRARNSHGHAERSFRIVAGDTLSLTPPMGFNNWYFCYDKVTQRLMENAADILVSSGMADAGYQYVNIDDCWMKRKGDEPYRDADGAALPNDQFPDMKGLADYIHKKGLKAGIYTSPGPWTCAGFVGAYGHEAAEVRRYVEWGFDFLKYDWCSYGTVAEGSDLPAVQKPYRLMGNLLRRQKRDVVFNVCQYGGSDVWKWAVEAGGQSWRTGGDLGQELQRIFEVALKNCELRAYNRPGGWNDPDYLQIGWTIGGYGYGESQPFALSPNEQYSFMSLWCLMAAPLFYSGDMTKLDEFTLNILCNAEVIEINQDPLGQCARVVGQPGKTFVLVKELEDGSKAIGLCNRGQLGATVTVAWSDVGLAGPQVVRDLWRQKDLGTFDQRFEANVPRRGVTLVRVRGAAK